MKLVLIEKLKEAILAFRIERALNRENIRIISQSNIFG